MMRNRPSVRGVSVLLLGLVAAGAGCQANAERTEATPANVRVVNDLCPIGKDPVNMESHTTALAREYQGQMVGFCCPGCVGYWDGMSEEQQASEMAKLVSSGHAPGFKTN